MIKLESMNDLIEVKDNKTMSPLIFFFLEEYLESLLKELEAESLVEDGAIFLLTDPQDGLRNSEMGLSLPLDLALPEFSEIINIYNGIEQIKILHSCFVINNSYAISVFVSLSLLDKAIEENLISGHTERTVFIKDSKLYP